MYKSISSNRNNFSETTTCAQGKTVSIYLPRHLIDMAKTHHINLSRLVSTLLEDYFSNLPHPQDLEKPAEPQLTIDQRRQLNSMKTELSLIAKFAKKDKSWKKAWENRISQLAEQFNTPQDILLKELEKMGVKI
jgi:post-segregation antitoxin (ccd killing protein)